MRVLVVENYQGTDLGNVGAALAEANAEIDVRKAYLGDRLPKDASEHDALVLFGGGQNALADDSHPYFPELLDLIRDFAHKDRSVLGICLGSQLLARAFGGINQVGGASEFGWHGVTLTEEAKTDAVLGAMPVAFPIFQWHDDTFTLPPSAVRLASSAVAENQAFRLGRAVYAFQFHFEADRAVVDYWTTAFADTVTARWPDWPERLPAEAARNAALADQSGLAIARAWVATIGR